jgi:hypothetical protein
MQQNETPPLFILRRIAAAADADPRTVARYLRGQRIRVGAVAERIARAVVEAGMAHAAAAGGSRRR